LKLRQVHYFSYLLSPSSKIKLVTSLVLPIFDYADSIFCEIAVGLEMKLNKALNTCIRFIYNLDRLSEILGYRYGLRFLRPSARRRLNLSLLVFKIFNCGAPGYLLRYVWFLNSCYYTRNRGINLRIPPCYSSLYKFSFTLAASKLWNFWIHLKKFLNLKILWGTAVIQPRVTSPNLVCVTIFIIYFFLCLSQVN
jgi:hypothetical protein